MSGSINTKDELDKVNDAIRKLQIAVQEDEEMELADLTRDLALGLGKAAKHKIDVIRMNQEEGGDVDGRAFSPVSNALEKIGKALDAMSKRRQGRIDEQKALVHAEIERLKLQRGASMGGDIARLIFPFQGNNRLTASPIIKQLNEAKVDVSAGIDADMEEVVDEDSALVHNGR
jgi:hypothetical protein